MRLTHRITTLVKGGVLIPPELPIGNKKRNLINMILRKTQIYNHLYMSFDEIRNFYTNSLIFKNKKATTQKNRKNLHWCANFK